MMMENKKTKLNNQGASLIEFIIVIAIMAIVIGGVVTGISLFTNTYAKQAARGLQDFINNGRTKAMSIAADEWNVEISYNTQDESFTFSLNKVTIKTMPDGSKKREVEVVEQEIYKGELKMYMKNGDAANGAYIGLNSTANTVRLVFSQSQGAIEDVRLGGYTLQHTVGQQPADVLYFTISRGNFTKKIAVYTLTGKYEVIE